MSIGAADADATGIPVCGGGCSGNKGVSDFGGNHQTEGVAEACAVNSDFGAVKTGCCVGTTWLD